MLPNVSLKGSNITGCVRPGVILFKPNLININNLSHEKQNKVVPQNIKEELRTEGNSLFGHRTALLAEDYVASSLGVACYATN
jgi:hypothetical protein